MKLTADTITDEQIREAMKAGHIERRDYVQAVQFKNAIVRARCADSLNARAEGKS